MTEVCYNTLSESETLSLARTLGEKLRPGGFVALFGGLGMGKTLFTRGLAEGIGLDSNQVSSPTYTVIHEYGGGKFRLIHCDMYRIKGEESLASTGYFDLLGSDGVIATEWSENIEEYLPEKAVRIFIAPGEGENSRKITICYPDVNGAL